MVLNESWEWDTQENELVIVLLSGNFKVESDKGNWETKNGRKDVFSGVAHTLYLPSGTKFTLTATSDALISFMSILLGRSTHVLLGEKSDLGMGRL
mgnify:CR=1 FL=1